MTSGRGRLADYICDTAVIRTDEDNGAVLDKERMGACLRHLGRNFGRQRVKLDVLWHGVADCLRCVRWYLCETQIFYILFDDKTSLMTKRCSWVRLIVRGWGAIAGLSASCARTTCCDGERAAPMKNATTIRGSLG